MMKNRVLCLFLAILISVSVLCIPASAHQEIYFSSDFSGYELKANQWDGVNVTTGGAMPDNFDTYKAQLRKYDDLIAYCTVHISVSEVYREVKNVEKLTFGERIVTALENTFYNISDDAQDFTVDFIAALPYLLIWAVIITLAVLILRVIWRKLKRKHEIRRLDKLCRQAQENQNGQN